MGDRNPFSETLDAGAGAAYWITGLPGVGKKTLAAALADLLTAQGRSVVRLDGTRLREILGGRFGHGQSDRRAVSGFYARLCEELTVQGHDVVIATVSMFHEARRWNRGHIATYVEIYLRASPAFLAARQPKGLVAAALAGRIRNVPGVDLPIEEPEAPDVLIELTAERTAADLAEEVLGRLARDKPGLSLGSMATDPGLRLSRAARPEAFAARGP